MSSKYNLTFIPTRLAVEGRPELSEFPSMVCFSGDAEGPDGRSVPCRATYLPDLRSYSVKEDRRSLFYTCLQARRYMLAISRYGNGGWWQGMKLGPRGLLGMTGGNYGDDWQQFLADFVEWGIDSPEEGGIKASEALEPDVTDVESDDAEEDVSHDRDPVGAPSDPMFSFIPKRLEIEGRPELSDFPATVCFAGFVQGNGCQRVLCEAAYQPELESLKTQGDCRVLRYTGLYNPDFTLEISHNLVSDGYFGEKFCCGEYAGAAGGSSWEGFFAHFSGLGIHSIKEGVISLDTPPE